MKTKTNSPVKNTPVTDKYSLSITFGDKTFTSTGKTIFEALEKIETPIKVTTKGFLTVTDGTKKAELMFMPAKAKRLFYPLVKVFTAKKLEYLLR